MQIVAAALPKIALIKILYACGLEAAAAYAVLSPQEAFAIVFRVDGKVAIFPGALKPVIMPLKKRRGMLWPRRRQQLRKRAAATPDT